MLSRACKRTIEAHCVLVFFGGVAATVHGSWILLVGFYIALNVLIDARSWLKPWTSDEDIAVYDGRVKEELLTQKAYPSGSGAANIRWLEAGFTPPPTRC